MDRPHSREQTMAVGSLGLGRPVQVAYAVPDLEQAVADWVARIGAGPFFVAEHIPLTAVRYRGAPGAFDHSSAYGQWGDVMVELVQDHTPGPSPVRDLLGTRTQGLHHLAFMVDDLDAELARLTGLGWPEALRARTASGLEFAFCDASASLGHMIELYEPSDALVRFYRMVSAAAANWTGDAPFRRL